MSKGTRNVTCIACKLPCQPNQNLVVCQKCRLHAHVKCTKVGMNFGQKNFVCSECHQKTAFLSRLVPSLFPPGVGTSTNDSNTTSLTVGRHPVANPKDYYSVDSMNSVLKGQQVDDLFVIHINASSLPKHFDTISSLCIDKFSCHPDVICITESRLIDKK